jgi:hypothetical protein
LLQPPEPQLASADGADRARFAKINRTFPRPFVLFLPAVTSFGRPRFARGCRSTGPVALLRSRWSKSICQLVRNSGALSLNAHMLSRKVRKPVPERSRPAAICRWYPRCERRHGVEPRRLLQPPEPPVRIRGWVGPGAHFAKISRTFPRPFVPFLPVVTSVGRTGFAPDCRSTGPVALVSVSDRRAWSICAIRGCSVEMLTCFLAKREDPSLTVGVWLLSLSIL